DGLKVLVQLQRLAVERQRCVRANLGGDGVLEWLKVAVLTLRRFQTQRTESAGDVIGGDVQPVRSDAAAFEFIRREIGERLSSVFDDVRLRRERQWLCSICDNCGGR